MGQPESHAKCHKKHAEANPTKNLEPLHEATPPRRSVAQCNRIPCNEFIVCMILDDYQQLRQAFMPGLEDY